MDESAACVFIFSVPSGCVDGAAAAAQANSFLAAPRGTGHEECESKPDRCFWTDGWGTRNMKPGICYYDTGTISC